MNKFAIVMFALIGSVAACDNELIKSTNYQATPIVTAPTNLRHIDSPEEERVNMAMAEEIDDKIRAAKTKQFCAKFKHDRGCATSDGDVANGCVMSTDSTGRCIVIKRLPK